MNVYIIISGSNYEWEQIEKVLLDKDKAINFFEKFCEEKGYKIKCDKEGCILFMKDQGLEHAYGYAELIEMEAE